MTKSRVRKKNGKPVKYTPKKPKKNKVGKEKNTSKKFLKRKEKKDLKIFLRVSLKREEKI